MLRVWLLAPSIGLVLAVALIGTGFAGLLEDREAVMRQISRAFRPLADIAKHNRFDAAETAKRGAEIASGLERFKDLFPAGSEHADHAAGPEIWSDRTGFEKAGAAAGAAAVALAQVTDAAALRDAVARLGAACKACHQAYRIDP